MNLQILLTVSWDVPAPKAISRYYFISLFGSIIIFVSLYIVWTKVVCLPYPMPNNGTVWGILNYVLVQPFANWVMFPNEIKARKGPFRKKVILLIAFNILRGGMAACYSLIPKLPLVRNDNWQWSLCILFPLLKKFNMRWNSKFIRSFLDCDEEKGTIDNIIMVEIVHSLSLTIVLGSSQINQFTTYTIIASDTLMNVWYMRNIVRLYYQGTDIANKQRDSTLRYLALKEFLEFLIPVVYCLTFIGTYLGPNYEIIGDMGSNMWHHQKVSNLYEKLQNILHFSLIETVPGGGFAFILWKFCNLNMYSGLNTI